MPAIEKIYSNRLNEIWDDGKVYHCLYKSRTAETQEEFIFDRTDVALQVVRDGLENSSAIWDKKGGKFYFQPNPKISAHKKIYLTQALYSAYSDKPLSWVKQGTVYVNDGDSHNLTSANLSHSRVDSPNNAKRCVWCYGGRIFLYHKLSQQTFFTGYDPELYRLLCAHEIVWYFDKRHKTLNAVVVDESGQKIPRVVFGFWQLVYSFHQYGARRDNFLEAIRCMQAELSDRGLVIDHFDSLKQNCGMENLSLMTSRQNSIKNNLTSKILYPFFLCGIYDGSHYRIVSGRMDDLGWPVGENELPVVWTRQFDFVLCPDAHSVIAYIKEFMDTPIGDITPAQNAKRNPENPYLNRYFGDFGIDLICGALREREVNEFELYHVEPDKLSA